MRSGSTTFYWGGGLRAAGPRSRWQYSLPFASRKHVDGPRESHFGVGKKKTFSTICIVRAITIGFSARKSTLPESRWRGRTAWQASSVVARLRFRRCFGMVWTLMRWRGRSGATVRHPEHPCRLRAGGAPRHSDGLLAAGVGPVKNVFIVESFIDELAAASHQRSGGVPKVASEVTIRAPSAVLALATEKAGWGRPLPPRQGRGVSLQSSFGGFLAQVRGGRGYAGWL